MTLNTQPREARNSVKASLATTVKAAENVDSIVDSIRFLADNYAGGSSTSDPFACKIFKCDSKTIDAEWFVPPGNPGTRRILYLHGGAWVGGSVDSHRHLIDAIASECACAVLGLNYRLAPEHPFPGGLEDCSAALTWLFEHGPDGLSPAGELFVVGDSAGGNLTAAVTALAIMRGTRLPDAIAMLSPTTDLTSTDKYPLGIEDPLSVEDTLKLMEQLYLGADAKPTMPLISPIFLQSEVLEKFPPTLIHASSIEYLRDTCVAFATALWESAVPVRLSIWPGQVHVFHLFLRDLIEARCAVRDIREFFDAL